MVPKVSVIWRFHCIHMCECLLVHNYNYSCCIYNLQTAEPLVSIRNIEVSTNISEESQNIIHVIIHDDI